MIRDRLFAAAFCVMALATLTPIWVAHYLPLLDLPNHLASIAVWHYYHDPKWDFAQYYDLNLVPLPYWAHYYTVHLLTYVTRSIELSNKIFLTVYALAVPTAALLFCRRFGRSHWLALFTFPLVWNFNFADGFIAYCAGFATLPLALVLVDRYAERPTWRGALAVVVVGSLTYFFHLLSYVLFLVCAGLLLLVQRRPFAPRLLAARVLPVLSCAGVGMWALRHANKMNFHRVTGTAREFVRDALDQTLMQLPERLFNFLPGHADEWMLVAMAVAWLALAITGARARAAAAPVGNADAARERGEVDGGVEQGRGWHGWGVELCFLAALTLYVLVPRSMRLPFYWHMINGRFVVAGAFFGVLALRGPIAGWRRAWLVPVVVAHFVYMGALSRAFVEFNRHAWGLAPLVAEIPPGKQVLTLMLRPMGDPTVIASAFNQFPSYVQLMRGGYNHYNFAEGFPLKYKHQRPAPAWSHADEFRWGAHARSWDYFLTFREGWEATPMKEPLANGLVRLVDQKGEWRLYQKLVPDLAVEPAPTAPPPVEPREP